MLTEEKIRKALALSIERAKSRGFTREYQDQKESQDNVISLRKLAPATTEKYDGAVFIWGLWRLSRNEPIYTNFSKDEPDPTPTQLKLFVEHYITTRREIPSKKSVCGIFISLISHWERTTSRSLDPKVKDDVLNFIGNDLTKDYGLSTKPRERFPVTAKDIDYLLHYLFDRDYHDFKHERARVQTASSLSLFAGSGSRAGAIVESSSYRNSNECLYYRHMTFHIKWGKNGGLIRWVTIDPEFLKGHRYKDDIDMPKNWFRGHPVLGKNFVFWVIVHGIADGAFKGLATVENVLSIKPPEGRESWTLEWDPDVKDLPFFRAVTPNGPEATKALSFSSLHHNNKSLAKRDGFKDNLRVHGIRGAVANKIDPKASEATRGQALDHQDHDTFLKYQALLKTLDIGALYYDLEPDYECRDMEQSMTHHRDTNVPQKLNASTFAKFQEREDIIEIEKAISDLTHQIDGKPQDHKDLTIQRSKLYGIKTKRLQHWKDEFVKKWWDTSYDEYIAGNDFSERDSTSLFEIYKKYVPERARLSENLFQEASLDSEVGQQCLSDLVTICTSTERVAYYPNMSPKQGQCPICSKAMSEIPLQGRAKHILQCQRKSLNGPPYQQRYSNERRAHRRVPRNFVQFCYLCAKLFCDEETWIRHCQCHLDKLYPRCGMLTFRYTLVAPGLCPFCLGDESKRADERFGQWLTKATLLNHIDKHLEGLEPSRTIACPHPSCAKREYRNTLFLRHHFHDVHSIEEPRSNCINRKRKWPSESEPTMSIQNAVSMHRRRLNSDIPDRREESPLMKSSASDDDINLSSLDELMAEFVCFDGLEEPKKVTTSLSDQHLSLGAG